MVDKRMEYGGFVNCWTVTGLITGDVRNCWFSIDAKCVSRVSNGNFNVEEWNFFASILYREFN